MPKSHEVQIATDRILTAIVKYGNAVYTNGLHAGVPEGHHAREVAVEEAYRDLTRFVVELRNSRESGNNLLANAEYHLTAARTEADKLRAELEQLKATPGVAALTAPLCPCRPNEAALHMNDCPVWVNVGPSLAQRQYVRRDSLTNLAKES